MEPKVEIIVNTPKPNRRRQVVTLVIEGHWYEAVPSAWDFSHLLDTNACVLSSHPAESYYDPEFD